MCRVQGRGSFAKTILMLSTCSLASRSCESIEDIQSNTIPCSSPLELRVAIAPHKFPMSFCESMFARCGTRRSRCGVRSCRTAGHPSMQLWHAALQVVNGLSFRAQGYGPSVFEFWVVGV